MDTPPLFDLAEPAASFTAEPMGRRSRKDPDPDRIRWGQYRPRDRVACDDCLADLVAAGGGPVARAARWRRQQHGQDQLLCGGHMELRRHQDGLDPLQDPTGRLR